MELHNILCAAMQDDICDKAKLRNKFGVGLYEKTMRWTCGEAISTSRFSNILNECFGQGTVAITSKEYKQIAQFTSSVITPYELLSLGEESIYRRWDRMLSEGNIPKNASSRMELAVFLTALLASDLSIAGDAQFEAIVKLYYISFEIIGITCEDSIMRRLCPGNLVKAKEDWCKAITGKEYSKTVLPYDLLCLTVYLALWRLRYPAEEETSKLKFAKQWYSIIHWFSMEPEFENTSTHIDTVIQSARQELFPFAEEETRTKISVSELSNNNDLFRDPRFLRQANLYYHVDMQAIYAVLNRFERCDLTVLDLGCGDGEVTCSRFGGIAAVSRIICVDSDARQLETAKARIERDPNKEKYCICQIDLRDNDLVPQLRRVLKENKIDKVDIVFSALTFHYLPHPEIVLSHIKTIIADDGYIILRELDDDTKIYYSQGDIMSDWMDQAVSSYQKVSQYSDRNCARKMHSWLALQGYSDIKLFFDQIDTCGKTPQERKDIFYIMVGFRKARAEKMLRDRPGSAESERYLHDVIQSCTELEGLFEEKDFWFFFTNYVAIARNHSLQKLEQKKRAPVELFLIRHASCDIKESDNGIALSVSRKGKQEISALTEHLLNIDLDEVVCSTMERAIETATPIAETHNLQLTKFPELNEIDRGEVRTDQMWLSNAQYYARWKKHETDLPFPNGENGMDVWVRSKYVIDRICENASAKPAGTTPYRACIITHGGTIRALICGLLGIPEQLRYQFAANLHSCSVSIIRLASDPSENANTDFPATIELFNDISHLRENV